LPPSWFPKGINREDRCKSGAIPVAVSTIFLTEAKTTVYDGKVPSGCEPEDLPSGIL